MKKKVKWYKKNCISFAFTFDRGQSFKSLMYNNVKIPLSDYNTDYCMLVHYNHEM